MIKIIYKLFKKRLNNLVFEKNIIHANWKDKCTVYYVDLDGLKYYLFTDPMDIPLTRFEYLQGLISLYEMGFNTFEYKLFLEGFKTEINKTVNDQNYRGSGLAKIMQLVNELQNRADIKIEIKTLLEMMAVILIREDENPEFIDHKILDLKVLSFERDKKEREISFFLQAGLNTFIPSLTSLETNWKLYLIEAANQKKMSKEILSLFLPQFKTESEDLMMK